MSHDRAPYDGMNATADGRDAHFKGRYLHISAWPQAWSIKLTQVKSVDYIKRKPSVPYMDTDEYFSRLAHTLSLYTNLINIYALTH